MGWDLRCLPQVVSTQQGLALITAALTFPLSLALNSQVLLSHLNGPEWPHTSSTWDTSLAPEGQLGSCAGDPTGPARITSSTPSFPGPSAPLPHTPPMMPAAASQVWAPLLSLDAPPPGQCIEAPRSSLQGPPSLTPASPGRTPPQSLALAHPPLAFAPPTSLVKAGLLHAQIPTLTAQSFHLCFPFGLMHPRGCRVCPAPASTCQSPSESFHYAALAWPEHS